eukprot:2666773-Lingulodinium_polyedra.AAC.1
MRSPRQSSSPSASLLWYTAIVRRRGVHVRGGAMGCPKSARARGAASKDCASPFFLPASGCHAAVSASPASQR